LKIYDLPHLITKQTLWDALPWRTEVSSQFKSISFQRFVLKKMRFFLLSLWVFHYYNFYSVKLFLLWCDGLFF
jgi:hypothetical protein